MLTVSEVVIPQALNKTSINLAEYVINPYRGCEFGCMYCYVRANKAVEKSKLPWGAFADARVNLLELLEKEIAVKKPRSVLLGSTTECFQPLEEKFGLSGRTIEVLNRHKVPYVILTRSPYILKYLPLLTKGLCSRIYFTTNDFGDPYKEVLEPKSPAFESRVEAIRALQSAGLKVIVYFSPVMPGVSNIQRIFETFKGVDSLECEALNFKLVNIRQIIDVITSVDPSLKMRYDRLLSDERYYRQTWEEIEGELLSAGKAFGIKSNFYIHDFGSYFKNTYERI